MMLVGVLVVAAACPPPGSADGNTRSEKADKVRRVLLDRLQAGRASERPQTGQQGHASGQVRPGWGNVAPPRPSGPTQPRVVPFEPRPDGADQPASVVRQITLQPHGQEVIEFEVDAPGKIEASLEAGRTTAVASLVLSGPGRRTPYAQDTGRCPLKLSHDVTDKVLSLGKNWTVSVRNLSPRTTVEGTIRVTYPQASDADDSDDSDSDGSDSDGSDSVDSDSDGSQSAEEKSLTVKCYQIVAAKGYTQQELDEMKAKLQAEERADAKVRWEAQIKGATAKNRLAGIVVPLIVQRLEETTRASAPTGFRSRLKDRLEQSKTDPVPPIGQAKPVPFRQLKSGRPSQLNSGRSNQLKAARSDRIKSRQLLTLDQGPAKDNAAYEIDTQAHLRTMVQAFKDVSPTFRARYLHPRYADLRPGQRVDKLQLGEDLLAAVKPDYQTRIKQKLQRAFAAEKPKFHWNAEQGQLQFQQIGSGGTKQSKWSARAGAAHQWKQMQPGLIYQQGFMQQLFLHAPDLNNKHTVRNYYRYRVALDWFKCIERDEITPDEPYFHVSATVPQYDPEDLEMLGFLQDGELYGTSSRVSRSYSGVTDGSVRTISPSDGLVFDAVTFGTLTTFSVDLFEEDWSKRQTTEAIHQQIEQLAQQLVDEIAGAMTESLQNAVIATVLEMFPTEFDLGGLLNLVLTGDVTLGQFLGSIENMFGEIDPTWLAIDLILTGGDFGSMLETLGAGCPELGAIVLAIKIAGPTVVEFFEELFDGNMLNAFETLLLMPVEIIKELCGFVAEIIGDVTEIIDVIELLLAAIDPDDYIGSQTVTIEQSHPDDVFQDAMWPRPGSAGYDTTSTGSAQQSNCSLVKGGAYWQPCLKLDQWGGSSSGGGGGGAGGGGNEVPYDPKGSSSAKYRLYYNVYRELDGGVENFGYTVKTGSEATRQHEYVAKGDGRIRVSVCSLSTEELPSVALAASNGPSGNNESSPGEFTVDARQGVPYTLSISNNTEHDAVWGYVTLREEPPTGVCGRVVAKTQS
ncbi:MAG: hypothetical protein ABIK89_24970, partial [Planctomycetota bacterium]